MSRLDTMIAQLDTVKGGRIWERLRYELRYARRVSEALEGRHEDLILAAVGRALAAFNQEGALTDKAALAIEADLMPMQPDCKKYRLMLCGHAHIDMNWMWRFDETVQLTIDTFRTVLNLMNEFPQFTFSQSQASVYRIIEEFAPDMLPEIVRRHREGRWEVTASTWVEADRNMPNAESTARHHLYTAAYLKQLGLTPSLVDFEPDTFGHHQNTPELLSQAGIRYYYHCRGLEQETLYRWAAPSGASVLAYREPFWYNDTVDGEFAQYAPAFCERFGVPCALRVYGVGDHGGGPTRQDILRALDMQTWPIYATIEFGSFHRFFESAAAAVNVPVIRHELNTIFPGCYTSQSRIKKGNRYAERMLAEAEQINAFAGQYAGAPYRPDRFAEGWRNVLFNQFHDILPGSGVTDTREYAMGLYQQSYAIANSAKRQAMAALSAGIDTSSIRTEPFDDDISTGAGVGYRVEGAFIPAPVEYGQGRRRIFHLFNSLGFERTEIVELDVWDLKAEEQQLMVWDDKGRPLPFQIVPSDPRPFWGHKLTCMMVEAVIPAYGYTTCIVGFREDITEPIHFLGFENVEHDEDWVMDNGLIRVQADPAISGGGILIHDHRCGRTYRADGFSLVLEDARRGMTAWTTGDPLHVTPIRDIRMKRTVSGPLCQELQAEADFGTQSRITYTISLRKGAEKVDIAARVRWLEPGDPEKQITPQLRFTMQTEGTEAQSYIYDIPGGLLARAPGAQEMPGLRFIARGGAALITDSKYGYLGTPDGTMGALLIRSSTDPDEYPELGNHMFTLTIALTDADKMALIRVAQAALSPIETITDTPHDGELPMTGSFMTVVNDHVEIQSVKMAENGKGLIVRGMELLGREDAVRFEVKDAKQAYLCDTFEKPIEELNMLGGRADYCPKAYGMFTLRFE